jgi:hypothetical protein
MHGRVVSRRVVDLLALVALLTGNPRWDDHLINAIGVFAAGMFISFAFRIAVNAFRPQPGASARAMVLNVFLRIALAAMGFIAIGIATFIDNMSFL